MTACHDSLWQFVTSCSMQYVEYNNNISSLYQWYSEIRKNSLSLAIYSNLNYRSFHNQKTHLTLALGIIQWNSDLKRVALRMSIYQSFNQSIHCQSVYLYLSVCLSICLSICLSACLFVYLPIGLYVCLYLCRFIFSLDI